MSEIPAESNQNDRKSKKTLDTIKKVVEQEELDTRLIIDSIPIGVCILDPQGKMSDVNVAFTKLFGYTKEELIGLNFTRLIPETNRSSFGTLHTRWQGQTYDQQGKWRMLNKAGEEFSVLANSSYQLDEHNGQPQQITFLVDVEDYEQAQRELQSTLSFLYRKLNAQENNQQLSEHDLKNNVGSMVNIADILLNRQPNEEQERWLRMLMQVGTKTLGMLKASSDYIRMEKGSYTPEISEFDLAKLVDEVSSELSSTAQRKSVDLVFSYEGTQSSPQDITIPMQADAFYIEQLLHFLLQNALEASPENSEITLDIKKNDALVLKFHNQGSIPEDIQSQFFDKYVTSGKDRGTGLGTYLAKLIVELHEGTIAYRTSSEKGTTIYVNLPRYLLQE